MVLSLDGGIDTYQVEMLMRQWGEKGHHACDIWVTHSANNQFEPYFEKRFFSSFTPRNKQIPTLWPTSKRHVNR